MRFFLALLQKCIRFLSFGRITSFWGLLPEVLLYAMQSALIINYYHKLSAMDVLARATMKDAANCDTQCELQNSVNH